MVKVLIYSSKEIYENSSYEGRAEAHLVAYRIQEDQNNTFLNDILGTTYRIVKNRRPNLWILNNDCVVYRHAIQKWIEKEETNE